MKYIEWNKKIAEKFFNADRAGERVLLAVTSKTIENIARENNTTFADFINAVKEGPKIKQNNQRNRICMTAFDAYDTCKNREMTYPIYVAYLALFVLAVTHGDSNDFSANNYYGRLRDILGEENKTGQYPSFDKMLELWNDLQRWSNDKKNGEYGEFYYEIYGKHIHVGLPIYQVVLTTDDVEKNLPKIFAEMAWDGDSKPTDMEIDHALEIYKHKLSSRTAKRVSHGSSEFVTILRQRLREVLAEYYYDDDHDPEKRHDGRVVLCMEIKEAEAEVSFYFRCKRSGGMPAEEFTIADKFIVEESNSSFSSPIASLHLDDWQKSASFNSDEECEFRYVGKKYFIFTKQQGLRGWVSEERYRQDEEFYLLVHNELHKKTIAWGEKNCAEFGELTIISGVPDSWCMFKISGVCDSHDIQQDMPALALDKTARIELRGGIRINKRNRFFTFARPNIFIPTATGEVFCKTDSGENYKLVPQYAETFKLPDNVPVGKWLTVEVASSKCKLLLEESRLHAHYEYKNINTGKEKFARMPDNIDFTNRRKRLFIGEQPGQLSDTLPSTWSPVWVIEYHTRKKAIALHVGDALDAYQAEQYSTKAVKRWQQVTYHERRKVTPQAGAHQQWQQLITRAKDA